MLQAYADNGHNSSTPRIMTGYYTFRYCCTLITYIKSFPNRTRILSNFARLKKIKVVHVLFFCTYTRTATDVQVPRVIPVKRIKMHFSSFTHYLPRLQCNKFIGTHVHFILDNNRTPQSSNRQIITHYILCPHTCFFFRSNDNYDVIC